MQRRKFIALMLAVSTSATATTYGRNPTHIAMEEAGRKGDEKDVAIYLAYIEKELKHTEDDLGILKRCEQKSCAGESRKSIIEKLRFSEAHIPLLARVVQDTLLYVIAPSGWDSPHAINPSSISTEEITRRAKIAAFLLRETTGKLTPDPNYHNKDGRSLLHEAATRGYTDIVETLIVRRAKVNVLWKPPQYRRGLSVMDVAQGDKTVALLKKYGAKNHAPMRPEGQKITTFNPVFDAA